MEDERAAGGSNHGDPKITWAEVLFVASQRVISFGGAEKRRDVRRTVLWPPPPPPLPLPLVTLGHSSPRDISLVLFVYAITCQSVPDEAEN